MTNNIEFTDSISVELVQSEASDDAVVRAARVSTIGRESASYSAGPERDAGLINYLVRERHGSPFEHNLFTFRVTAPIFVWREHMRHRVMSYNEESGRYTELKPHFYLPSIDRNLIQSGKTGHYEFSEGTREQYSLLSSSIESTCFAAYSAYVDMLNAGIAKEVARMVLPVNVMSTAYVTCNARALMHFLSLRTKDEHASYKSYPQHEIELVARQYEEDFARLMPLTYAAFVGNGRVAP